MRIRMVLCQRLDMLFVCLAVAHQNDEHPPQFGGAPHDGWPMCMHGATVQACHTLLFLCNTAAPEWDAAFFATAAWTLPCGFTGIGT